MKSTMRRSLSLLGISMAMALSVAAQEQPKVKINDNEAKYKSEDLKVKEQKEELKYKSENEKIKLQEDESKYKSADLKIKDNENERKVKGKVKPMRPTTTVRTVIKTGETQIRAKEHLAPLPVEPTASTPARVVTGKVAVPKTTTAVKKTTRKYAASKRSHHKRAVARRSHTTRRYVVRTKIVRDTVYVPSPPERVVSTQPVYIHDTVFVTRVDTVLHMRTTNTYGGYRVPRGDFKKVKLKRDKDGDVWMKRKE